MSNIREVGTDGVTRIVPTPASQPGDVFPSGIIMAYGGDTAPTNWLLCDGTAVSRGTYAALFAVIGETFGAGDGASTFGLPDFRDKVPVGHSATKALGSTGGAATVALVTANIPAHTHTYSGTTSAAGAHSHTVQLTNIVNDGGTSNGTHLWGTAGNAVDQSSNPSTTTASNHTHTFSGTTSSVGSTTAHENMPPYQSVNYIIKT